MASDYCANTVYKIELMSNGLRTYLCMTRK